MKRKKRNISSWVKALRIYSFNNFSIYHTAVLTIVMLYLTPPVFIYLITGNLHSACPSITPTFLLLPLSQPSDSGNHMSDLFSRVWWSHLDSTYNWDHSVYLFYLSLFKGRDFNIIYSVSLLYDLFHLA